MKSIYAQDTLGDLLRYCRDQAKMSQEQLAIKLNVDQKYVSNAELNRFEPRLKDLSNWFMTTKCYEGWEAIVHMNQLTPFSAPPIMPELAQSFSSNLMNAEEQLTTALQAVKELQRYANHHVPGQPFEMDSQFYNYMQDLFDLRPMVHTTFYSAERSLNCDIQKVIGGYSAQIISSKRHFQFQAKEVTG